MNPYCRKPNRSIEDALRVPADMMIRVTDAIEGLRPEFQPEIGRVYPAVRGKTENGYKTFRKGRPFCYINLNGRLLILRGAADTGTPPEYEEIFPAEPCKNPRR